MTNNNDITSALLIQKHQLEQSQNLSGQQFEALSELESRSTRQGEQLDLLIEQAESLLQKQSLACNTEASEKDIVLVESLLDQYTVEASLRPSFLHILDSIVINEDTSWQSYMHSVQKYAVEHNIDMSGDHYTKLMSPSQRIAFEKRLKEEFTYKNAHCDKYDYMIAATCGAIGGLIDVLFVGAPGEGFLGKVADKSVDGAVCLFAKFNGWTGGREDSDSTKSAIAFLERKFKVNYDHRHGGDVGHAFKMSTRNHHVKSLAHSPDLVGLFFSILGQFTNTAYFVDQGRIISVDTDTFELHGNNFISKVYCGFVNWLGHLFSDVAGSSGASGRGSGIPIPFFSLLQFINIGEFGQYKQSFSTIAVQVFEQGYDFRHGLAMAIPVMVTELLTRIMWSVKQRYYHDKDWRQCVPTASNPELRRMLLVAHGSLCLIDATDAALRSGGDIITFLLRTNLIGFVRFGTLALKELNNWNKAGHLDHEAIDEYLDQEYMRMLGNT